MQLKESLLGLLKPGKVYDLAIVAGDVLLGTFLGKKAAVYFTSSADVQPDLRIAVGIAVAIIAYFLALFSPLRRELACRPKQTIKESDNALLAFFSLLAGLIAAIIPTYYMGTLNEGTLLIITVCLFVIIAVLCFISHYIIFKEVGTATTGHNPSKTATIAGALMIYPVIILAMLPANTIAAAWYAEGRGNNLTPTEDFVGVFVAAAVLAVIPLWLAYIPRKVSGILFGSKLSAWGFYCAIFCGYLIKFFRLRGWLF